LKALIDNYKATPKKWIRLRKTVEEKENKEIKEHEIDIDTWPGLSPFMEIEGKNREDIENILNMLGYSFKDTISCTVDEIYQKISIDINNMKELKFESVK